jgi:hypothetical protein
MQVNIQKLKYEFYVSNRVIKGVNYFNTARLLCGLKYYGSFEVITVVRKNRVKAFT